MKLICRAKVAEHLSPEHADHFVKLLTTYEPARVFFGAATPFQDRGNNPSHLNENTFEYWIEIFQRYGYTVDWPRTAWMRHKLLADHGAEMTKAPPAKYY